MIVVLAGIIGTFSVVHIL